MWSKVFPGSVIRAVLSPSFSNYYGDVTLQRLAQETARTPVEDSAFEYVDRSLIILDRTVDVHSERIRQEFLVQREYVTAYIKEMESKIDGRLVEEANRNI